MTDLHGTDPVHELLLAVAAKEETLVRRMLSVWQMEWGEPMIVRLQAPAKPYNPFAMIQAVGDPKFYLWNQIVGLTAESSASEDVVRILVSAKDHVDSDWNVLPPLPPGPALQRMQVRC